MEELAVLEPEIEELGQNISEQISTDQGLREEFEANAYFHNFGFMSAFGESSAKIEIALSTTQTLGLFQTITA